MASYSGQPPVSDIFLTGLFEFGVGSLLGTLADTIAPEPDASKPIQQTAMEVTAQVGISAVAMYVAGGFVMRQMRSPDATSGFLLAYGLLASQSTLAAKLKILMLQLRVGAIAFFNPDTGLLAKTASQIPQIPE